MAAKRKIGKTTAKPAAPKFRFKPGSHLPLKKAAVVGRELERLEQRGSLTAERVVKAAHVKASPLHDLFEWSNKKAAAAYRLTQARYIIRSVEVVYEDAPEAAPIRAYVAFDAASEPIDADNRYKATHVVMSDSVARERWLQQAWRELLSWKSRWRQFTEFAVIFREIDAIGPGGVPPKSSGRKLRRTGPK